MQQQRIRPDVNRITACQACSASTVAGKSFAAMWQ
jgi:hypothetical protein